MLLENSYIFHFSDPDTIICIYVYLLEQCQPKCIKERKKRDGNGVSPGKLPITGWQFFSPILSRYRQVKVSEIAIFDSCIKNKKKKPHPDSVTIRNKFESIKRGFMSGAMVSILIVVFPLWRKLWGGGERSVRKRFYYGSSRSSLTFFLK